MVPLSCDSRKMLVFTSDLGLEMAAWVKTRVVASPQHRGSARTARDHAAQTSAAQFRGYRRGSYSGLAARRSRRRFKPHISGIAAIRATNEKPVAENAKSLSSKRGASAAAMV